MFLSFSLLNGGIIWDTTKAVGKGATVYGTKKAWGYYKRQKSKKIKHENKALSNNKSYEPTYKTFMNLHIKH